MYFRYDLFEATLNFNVENYVRLSDLKKYLLDKGLN